MDVYMSKDDIRRFNSYMVKAGYNITTLAQTLKMSRNKLSSRVNGRTDWTRTEMEAVGQALHESPRVIFYAPELR